MKKKADPIENVRSAWRSLYPVVDAPFARARSAAEKMVELEAKVKAATTDREELLYRRAWLVQFESFKREWDSLNGAVRAMQKFRQVQKLALHGRTFKLGRKLNTGGPIRKAIAKLLKCERDLKPRTLWAMLADAPPRGWTFRDNRLGKYAEGPRGRNMSYGRFSNVAKEERDKLK